MDQTILGYLFVTALVGGLGVLYTLLVVWSPPPITTHESEKKYLSHGSPKKPLPLSPLSGAATVDLTVVVPAFNETERLPIMMDATIAHLKAINGDTAKSGKKTKSAIGTANGSANANANDTNDHASSKRTFEVVIVDDGSTDTTTGTALEIASKYPECDIRVVTLEKNLGKGGAVRHGMLYGGGRRLLMVDADGASKFEDLEALWVEMDKLTAGQKEGGEMAVVVGSRAHMVKSEAVVKRSLIRNILMYGLHTILRIVGVGHIRDTQCGFKLFSRPAAQLIFPSQHLPTWIFDVELLLLAKMLAVPVGEVPIEWHEIPGSKLNVVTASVQMLRDLLVVRANHLLGRWRPVGGRG